MPAAVKLTAVVELVGLVMVADGTAVFSNQEKLYGEVPPDGEAESVLLEGNVMTLGVAVAVTLSGAGVGVGVGVGVGIGVGIGVVVGSGAAIGIIKHDPCITPTDTPSIPNHIATAGSTAPRLNPNLATFKLRIFMTLYEIKY